ncbi:MAG: dehydratase [Gammaproteobacteria bacterium]|nr:dehydratase [Gammaproteobacteria bacterium]
MSKNVEEWFFEDFTIGDQLITKGRTVTETDISLSVAISGHSQPIFIDEEFAKTTSFGTRIAPGELTIGLLAGLLTRLGILENQVGLIEITCKFPNAVKANDTVHAETDIIDVSLCSKKDRGIVSFNDRLLNQRQEVVLDTRRVAMFLCRSSN